MHFVFFFFPKIHFFSSSEVAHETSHIPFPSLHSPTKSNDLRLRHLDSGSFLKANFFFPRPLILVMLWISS